MSETGLGFAFVFTQLGFSQVTLKGWVNPCKAKLTFSPAPLNSLHKKRDIDCDSVHDITPWHWSWKWLHHKSSRMWSILPGLLVMERCSCSTSWSNCSCHYSLLNCMSPPPMLFKRAEWWHCSGRKKENTNGWVRWAEKHSPSNRELNYF